MDAMKNPGPTVPEQVPDAGEAAADGMLPERTEDERAAIAALLKWVKSGGPEQRRHVDISKPRCVEVTRGDGRTYVYVNVTEACIALMLPGFRHKIEPPAAQENPELLVFAECTRCFRQRVVGPPTWSGVCDCGHPVRARRPSLQSEEPATHDPINHPSHYVVGKMEAIDVIENFELGFRLGNVVKYVLRAGRKNDALEDLKKARWYLDRAIAKAEEKS